MVVVYIYLIGVALAALFTCILTYQDIRDGEVITRKDLFALTIMNVLSWIVVIAQILVFGDRYFSNLTQKWADWWEKPVFGGD